MKLDTLTTPSPELKQHADDLRRDAGNVAQDLKKHAVTSYNEVLGEAKTQFGDVRARANDLTDDVRDFIREKPFQAFGLGVLTGALLVTFLRSK